MFFFLLLDSQIRVATRMNKIYTFLALALFSLTLVSFSSNPPDGKTGAPGDSLCTECHTQTSPPINGEISVEGFPSTINPGETYLLTVVNRNTIGDAVKGGFQMTILGPFNSKIGEMTMPSDKSIVTNANGRQYFEHNPAVAYPDSNVLKWTVEWTAPLAPGGTQITWYAAGNIANGNFDSTGDRIVTANGTGTILVAGTKDLSLEKPSVYPNPGVDHINIVLNDGSSPDGHVIFYNMNGSKAGDALMQQGRVNTPDLPLGIYVIEIETKEKSYAVRWTKI